MKKDTANFTPERVGKLRNTPDFSDIPEIQDFSKGHMRTTVSDRRLREIAALTPSPDADSPEIRPDQAKRARLAHESHPQWYGRGILEEQG